MSNILVMYYSFEGFTKEIGDAIANELDADVQEIKPEKELKSRGFSKFIWGGSQVVMGKTPELLPFDKDIDDYDTIFIGSPIWAGTYAPPVKTLLQKDGIVNKKIIYFFTHQGGPGSAVEKARKVIEKRNVFLDSKDFLNRKDNWKEMKETAIKWAEEIKNTKLIF